jgi:hypothetical protein
MRAARRDGLCLQHHAMAATAVRLSESEQIHAQSMHEHMVGEDGKCVGWCQMCIKEKKS